MGCDNDRPENQPGPPGLFQARSERTERLDYDDLADMLAVFVPTLFRLHAHPADRVRQHRQPAAGARPLARTRNQHHLTLGASRPRIIRQLPHRGLLLFHARRGLRIGNLESVPRRRHSPRDLEHAAAVRRAHELTAPPADWRVILFILTSAVMSTGLLAGWRPRCRRPESSSYGRCAVRSSGMRDPDAPGVC